VETGLKLIRIGELASLGVQTVRRSLFIILTCLFFQISILPFAFAIPSTGTIDVFFSPNGGATEAIVHEINSAKLEILVQAYSFTSKPIAKALLDAKKRSISIIVVLDKSQRKERYTEATFLFNAGIPVFIDNKHAIAHNKIIIIDRQTLITGSFNFTRAAEEKNAENLLVIKGNKPLVDRYIRNFEDHRQHSEPYQGK
jgi:phosphatidylserine/phosphatidylglycerophosphate/cardiolipin synthase-like enzyme